MAVNPLMDNARSAGLNGIQEGQKRLEGAAQEVAELNAGSRTGADGARDGAAPDQDSAEALVQIRLYQRQVPASARVVETADAVVGFLLDVHA
jgi:hypothetical protein